MLALIYCKHQLGVASTETASFLAALFDADPRTYRTFL